MDFIVIIIIWVLFFIIGSIVKNAAKKKNQAQKNTNNQKMSAPQPNKDVSDDRSALSQLRKMLEDKGLVIPEAKQYDSEEEFDRNNYEYDDDEDYKEPVKPVYQSKEVTTDTTYTSIHRTTMSKENNPYDKNLTTASTSLDKKVLEMNQYAYDNISSSYEAKINSYDDENLIDGSKKFKQHHPIVNLGRDMIEQAMVYEAILNRKTIKYTKALNKHNIR